MMGSSSTLTPGAEPKPENESLPLTGRLCRCLYLWVGFLAGVGGAGVGRGWGQEALPAHSEDLGQCSGAL